MEVNLASGSGIKLKTLSNCQISVTEQDDLMSRIFTGSIQISLLNPESLSYYGIIEQQKVVEDNEEHPEAITRSFFSWVKQELIIKKELLYFSSSSFSTRIDAENYATLNNIPYSKIAEMPLINSTVRIINSENETFYMETPLKIHSTSDVFINGSSLPYSGSFVLKTVKGKLILNQYLELEEYLSGVVPNEIGNNSPFEALKAQAVAARTHAITLLVNNRHKADGFDLCNDTHCQVYKGKYLQNLLIRKAIDETSAEIILTDNYIADATYHSSCGGKTDASSAIWKGKPVSHLNGVTCIVDADSIDLSSEAGARYWINAKSIFTNMNSWERGALYWEKKISSKDVAKNIGLNYINRIEILERSRSGRIVSIRFSGNKQVLLDNEYKIRQAFNSVLSSFFFIEGTYEDVDGAVVVKPRQVISLKGKGAGHGVGMCQIGAIRMARAGATCLEILQHYYPGTQIVKDWKDE